ncbi:hypothetical protein Tco_0155476 [Tanacetum coccineum]
MFSTSYFAGSATVIGGSVLIETEVEPVPNSNEGSLGRKDRPLLATLERGIFMDIIRKLVSKIFCILPIIFGKKLETTSKDDGVMNKEKMTFQNLDMSNDYRKKVRNVFLGSFGKGQPLSIGKQIEESPEKINRWFTAIRFVHDSKGSEFGTTKWIKPRDVNLKILEDITKELGERRNRIFFTKTSELFFCKLASLNTDRIFSTHGERNKNVSLTFWIIEHYAENLSKIEEDGKRKKGFCQGCDLIITLTEEDSLVLEKGYSQKDEKQGQKRQNQARNGKV